MAMLFLQGFEHFKPTSVAEDHVLPTEVRNFLGFALPQNTANWFLDSAGGASNDSGPLVTTTDFRIDGQSLVIKRPDSGVTNNPLYNGLKALDLTYNIASQRQATVGFAMRLSKVPEVPVPLVQFYSDNGVSAGEQCSLWLGINGQLFFSSVDFDITSEAIITPTPIAGGSVAQAFNYDAWNYIEVTANYNTSPGTLIVAVNNINVIDGIQPTNANKDGKVEITQISLINCQNTYYPDDSYDMYLDDIYFLDGAAGTTLVAATGPQHIILLEPDATTQNEWVIQGGEATSNLAVDGTFDKSDLTDFLENNAADDEEIFTLENLPSSVVEVSAVQLSMFANVDSGSATVDLKIVEGADTEIEEVTINDTDIRNYTRIFEQDAADANWSISKLNTTSIAVEVTA